MLTATVKHAPHISTAAFLADVFGSRLARDGKVIHRATRDVERYMGPEAFIAEVYRRGFRAVENAGQIVLFYNAEPVKILPPGKRNPGRAEELQFFRRENCRFPTRKSRDFRPLTAAPRAA